MSFRRHATFLGKLEAVLPWLVVALLVAGLGGGAWWYFMRRPATTTAAPIRSSDPAMVRLLEESRELERRFERARELGTPAVADLAHLERAIELHRQWMQVTGRNDGEAVSRRDRLDSALARERGRVLAEESRAAELRAQEAQRVGDRAAAIDSLAQALEVQHRVNSLPADAGWRDLGREAVLGQALELLRVQPFVEQLVAGRWAAKERLEQRDWVGARREFEALRLMQLRVNREFPRTQFSDIAELDRIDSEIESLKSAETMTELEAALARAGQEQAAGSWEAAAASFAHAAELQARINREFSRGRFASVERLDELEVSRQSALSRPLATSLAELDRTITEALRRETFADIERSATRALGLADQMLAQFPRSRLLDGPLRRKFSYLSLVGAEVGTVVNLTRDRFVPLTGAQPVRIFSREVPQALYQRVMNSNPSRNPGADLPVDSVPLADAEEFCRRLTWLLGRPVRLPNEREFRAAVAQAGAAESVARAWASDAGATKSRGVEPTAAVGELRDLLGNLAEWLAPADERSTDAPIAGGSYQDSRDTLSRLPIARIPRTERSRTVGFRVVVIE